MFIKYLFLLLCGHAVADYALQADKMIMLKNPEYSDPLNAVRKHYGPWWWTMLAHSLINGLAVYLITGSLSSAISETAIHFAADFAKCIGFINTNTDQIIHITCKVLWAVYATYHQGYL